MMWLELISIAGSLGSVAGAYYAWRQATSARGYAADAKKSRDSAFLISEFDPILKTVRPMCVTAREIFKKYCTSSGIEGASLANDMLSARGLLESINDCVELNADFFRKTCEDIEKNLDKMTNSQIDDEKMKAGKAIYNSIMVLINAIDKEIKQKKEAIVA